MKKQTLYAAINPETFEVIYNQSLGKWRIYKSKAIALANRNSGEAIIPFYDSENFKCLFKKWVEFDPVKYAHREFISDKGVKFKFYDTILNDHLEVTGYSFKRKDQPNEIYHTDTLGYLVNTDLILVDYRKIGRKLDY